MVETQPLTVADGSIGLAAGESVPPTRQGASSSQRVGRFFGFFLAVTAGVSGWFYYQTSSVLREVEDIARRNPSSVTPADTQFLARMNRWRFVNPLLVAGVGITLSLFSLSLLKQRERFWETRIKVQSGALEATATRLRLYLTEKTASEAQLARRRQELEEQLASLTRTHERVLEELNRRKRTEKTLSWEQRELTRSKDVLELHVQARAQELQKLQRRHELILNSAGEGICGLDLDGTITFANPAAARITGWSIEELVGKPAEEIFQKPLTDGKSIAGLEEGNGMGDPTFARKDGTYFLAEFDKTSIEEGGRPVGTVFMFKDVTSRRQAEHALAEKAAELARSNAELEQFAFVASHDLQEPLRKILAFGDRLRAKCEGLELAEGRDYLERMQNAAARMQRLILDLLTFSRVISRSEPFGPVDLGAVTRDVLNDLEVPIEKSKAVVEVGELPTIEGDAVQMRQLLQNLISNALKFQPPGGTPRIRLKAKMSRQGASGGHTAIIARNAAGEVQPAGEAVCEISVEDNGIGFEEKYLDRIFVVFQRLHGRQEYEGTGIGLAVCRRIVDRHNGTITARSKSGEGATFLVTLPVRQPKNAEIPA